MNDIIAECMSAETANFHNSDQLYSLGAILSDQTDPEFATDQLYPSDFKAASSGATSDAYK